MRGPTAFWQALEAARRENLRDSGAATPVPGGDGQTRRQVLLALGGKAAALPLIGPERARARLAGRVA